LLEVAASSALLQAASLLTRPALAQDAAAPSLRAIRAVTITAADLAVVESAWTKFMGYRLVRRGKLDAATVASWGAPGLKGKRYIILGPESGETFYLRFVEQVTPEGYDATQSFGWNATEITVQNSVELYERLKDSPFKVRGPPGLVPTYPYLRALGAVGPAGERLNLTWITEKRPDLAEAKSFVGRCFIATNLVPDLPAALEFYRTTFGSNPSPIRKLPTLELAVVPLSDGCKIEVDQHKPGGVVRERVSKGLPPGLAIVTFEASAFDATRAKYLTAPRKATLEPYRGHRTAVMTGTGGELMELVEA
jgi:catechol 2,3-dioxygenase-like lactoylglutathione lyase family enzyme